MKKKTMAVGGLLLAVAMTGYSVAGTYAKYVSKVDFTDEARVARWELTATDKDGNKLEATNTIDLFANSYTLADNGKTYVKAVNGDKVVAPGTKGEYQINLDGNMETRYALNFEVKSTEDIVIYYDLDENNKVINMSTTKDTQAYEYHPLKYTVVYTKDGKEVIKDPNKQITNKTAAEVKTMLDAYNAYVNAGSDFGPGNMADLSYTISWEWDTNNVVIEKGVTLSDDEVNKLDTFAGQNVDDISKAKFDVTISATQVAKDHSTKTN